MLNKNILNHAILSCKHHRDLDKKTIKEFIPGYKLMENAGVEIFKIIKKEFKKKNKIKILCGPGNNGGDGFIVAKLLKENGYLNVDLFCLVSKKELKGDAKLAAKSFNGKLKSFSNFKVSNDDLIIDGLFGSGLKKNISGNLKKIIKKINLKKPYCISIDIPSGINGDTGEIQGIALQSNDTITFTRKKPGHLLSPGKEYCGNLIIADIGIKLENLGFKPKIFENHPDIWKNNFPWPNQKSHKYTRGYALIVCGEKMTGASRLAARGAARIGCGLICLGVPRKAFNIYATENPIALIEEVEDEKDLNNLFKDKRINTILIGPGLGISDKKLKIILKIIKEKERIIVLDADALKNNFKKIILKKRTKIVITPHQGEFSQVLKSLKIKNNKNKFLSANEFVKKKLNYKIGCL